MNNVRACLLHVCLCVHMWASLYVNACVGLRGCECTCSHVSMCGPVRM